jgi:hypothetical protein
VQTPLARETQIQRLLDLLVAPRVLDRSVGTHHLEQEPCAAAGRMALLERDLIAGTHHPGLVTTLPHPEAAFRRRSEAATVGRVAKLCLHRPRAVARIHLQMRVERIRIDHLARVHLPVRVPDRLELTECLDELGAEHLGKQLRACVAISVLTRQRSAIVGDQVARVLHERAVVAHALGRQEVPVDS